MDLKTIKKVDDQIIADMKNRISENYYSRQVNKLEVSPEGYAITAKFTDPNGNSTNFLDLNKESIPEIITWLKQLEAKL